MFMMKGMITLFLSLALGYVLCILAKKQDGLLKTLGYTLGISIMALSLLGGIVESCAKNCMMNKMVCMHTMMKHGPGNWQHK